MSAPAKFTPNDWTMFNQYFDFLIERCKDYFRTRFNYSWDGKLFYAMITRVTAKTVDFSITYNGGFVKNLSLPVEYFLEQTDVQTPENLIE